MKFLVQKLHVLIETKGIPSGTNYIFTKKDCK